MLKSAKTILDSLALTARANTLGRGCRFVYSLLDRPPKLDKSPSAGVSTDESPLDGFNQFNSKALGPRFCIPFFN